MAAPFLPEVTESQLSGTTIRPPFVVRVPFNIRRQRSPGPSPLGQSSRAGKPAAAPPAVAPGPAPPAAPPAAAPPAAAAAAPAEIYATPVPLGHEPPISFREEQRPPASPSGTGRQQQQQQQSAVGGGRPSDPLRWQGERTLWEERQAEEEEEEEARLQRLARHYLENVPGPSSSTSSTPLELRLSPSRQQQNQLQLQQVELDVVPADADGDTLDGMDVSDENDSLLRSESDKRRNDVKLGRGAVLVWKDLTVAYGRKKAHPYKVVQGLTGYALTGKLLAVMGPPRCGKSTVLKALAGILPSYARVYGEIFLNGRPQFVPAGSFVYVEKEQEAMLETLTIRECLHYATLLRFPECSMSCADKSALVEAVIAETSLIAYATCRLSTVTVAERKRLSIAIQLLTKPRLVFVDEPNFGLDSVAGLMFMATLKNLATSGRTVVITLEHASSEAYSILDYLLLLSHGRTIYFGEALGALDHFAVAGFPCPALQSPPDHFMRAINPEFDKVVMTLRLGQEYEQGDMFRERLESSVVIRTLETTFQASMEASSVLSVVIDLAEQERPPLEGWKTAGAMIRLGVLTWRSYLNMTRDFHYYWLRLALFCFLMISVGTVFYKADEQSNSVRARASAIFLCVSLLSLMASAGFSALVKDLKVYWQERAHRQTGPVMFTLGHLLSSIPFLFLLSSVSSGVAYFLIGLRPVFGFFMYFVLVIFLCLIIVDGLLMVVASIVPKAYEGLLIVAILQVFFVLVAGYFQLEDQLPKPVWKYPTSYVSFHTYAVGGLLQNEFSGMNATAERTLSGTFQVNSAHGKWINLLLLAGIALGYRLVLFVSLVLAEFVRFLIDMIRALRKQNLSVCLT